MKKILTVIFAFLLLLSSARVVFAKIDGLWNWREDIRNEVKGIKDELKQERKELKEEIKSRIEEELGKITGTPSPGARREIKHNFLWDLTKKYPFVNYAGVRKATIELIGTNSLVVKLDDNKTATLNITDKTIILRKYGGKSSLSEFYVGDMVTATGTWTQTDPPVLNTKVLRNLSIQKRKATFWGRIKLISGNTFVLTTMFRGDQTVKIDASTKIVNRREETISFADLKVGHRVRVSGIWDSTLKTIEEVRTIKDWSLAPWSTPTPTPI